jgi:hypothetical protein
MATPPSSCQEASPSKMVYKTQRSCSIDNSTDREPICRVAPIYHRRDRELSVSSTNDAAPPLCAQPSVTKLRKYFESRKRTTAIEKSSQFDRNHKFAATYTNDSKL